MICDYAVVVVEDDGLLGIYHYKYQWLVPAFWIKLSFDVCMCVYVRACECVSDKLIYERFVVDHNIVQ